jgi:hypothetical protein
MKRSLFTSFGVLFFALVSQAASAGVVYNWFSTNLSEYVYSVTGRIEVTDEAWRAGHLANQAQIFTIAPATGGLVELRIDAEGIDGIGGMLIRQVTCNDLPTDPSECNGANNFFPPGDFEVGSVLWQYDLSFGLPFLDVRAECCYAFLSSVEAFSRAIDFYIDYGSGGAEKPCQVIACRANGFWLIDPRSIPVSEPSALALLSLSLAGLVVTRRRKQ